MISPIRQRATKFLLKSITESVTEIVPIVRLTMDTDMEDGIMVMTILKDANSVETKEAAAGIEISV